MAIKKRTTKTKRTTKSRTTRTAKVARVAKSRTARTTRKATSRSTKSSRKATSTRSRTVVVYHPRKASSRRVGVPGINGFSIKVEGVKGVVQSAWMFGN